MLVPSGNLRMNAAEAMYQSDQVDLSNLEQLHTLSINNDLDASAQPIVQAVWYLLNYAFEHRVSDIHIEPKRDESWVRMRIDGVLHRIHRLPKAVHGAILSRFKTLSRLDIAERRRPQDGRFKTKFKYIMRWPTKRFILDTYLLVAIFLFIALLKNKKFFLVFLFVCRMRLSLISIVVPLPNCH